MTIPHQPNDFTQSCTVHVCRQLPAPAVHILCDSLQRIPSVIQIHCAQAGGLTVSLAHCILLCTITSDRQLPTTARWLQLPHYSAHDPEAGMLHCSSCDPQRADVIAQLRSVFVGLNMSLSEAKGEGSMARRRIKRRPSGWSRARILTMRHSS